MNNSSEKGPSKAELEELTLLLENRTFVDYFNTFLCLPVFGQHVLYNFMEMEFEFEPPIRNRRHLYLDRREVLRWLCTERLRLFKRSALYTEYHLCMLLRNTAFELPGFDIERQHTGIFNKNVIGTTVGMALFRESMRGTCGENVYRCWKDIEAWRLIEDPVKKMYWKHVIKTHYVNESSRTKVASKLKVKVFHGILNFDLVPESDFHQQILDSVTDHTFHPCVESDGALLKLQVVLLDALRKYWLPRHLLHIMKTVSKEVLDLLKKPAPGDTEYVDLERRLRCRYMFPTIYQESSITSPETTVLVSQSADELSKTTLTYFDDDYLNEEREIVPTDLLSLWGGPAKEIEVQRVTPSSYSPFLPEIYSPSGGSGNRKLSSANTGTASHIKSPIPIVLTSYLGGKKRTLLRNFPKTTNRVIWSLASDTLACCPFREFLQQNEQLLQLQYLGFWTDVRSYLDTDEHATDGYGHSLKRKLARRIADVYLSKDGKGSDIFSEKLKMSLFTAVSTNDDISLLCMTQDIVQARLWEPLKLYIQKERHTFMKQVRGQRYQLDRKQRRAIDQAEKLSKSKSPSNAADLDPLYFFNCVTLDADSATSSPFSSCSPFSPTIPCDSTMSRPATSSYHVSITEEQMWKAMEIAVLCSEYGVSMMLPQYLPQPSQLVDILHSDYGSLHVTRVPTVRHEWLRSLSEKPKINLETIKVSREVFVEKVDISTWTKDPEREDAMPKVKSRVTRRIGPVIDRPKRPKSLMEALSTPVQFDFFKRFMNMHKMSLPLLFWRAVEDLQEISNGKTRQMKVTQIKRKFFGRYAKYGAALDCDEEIIRQIPNMTQVNPGILICAQAAVFRSLERNWYPEYSDTFPPDSDSSSTSSYGFLQSGIMKSFGEAADFINKTKKAKKRTLGSRKTMAMWKIFSRALSDFVKATSDKCESQLFELFLKYEVEREKQSPNKEQTSHIPTIEKNIMMSIVHDSVQTRVVVRNRLVIMNRLPSDLRFWIEVRKYQNLVDSALQKSSVSDQDTEFTTDKARSIISCFLASEIMPKVQVNVPNDVASNIVNSLASVGPKRGLFHDAIVLLFPILYHYYRKFSENWMKGNIPDEYFDSIEMTLQGHVSTTPHRNLDTPDFTSLNPTQIKTTTNVYQDQNTMKIHFSISDGVTLIYPQTRQNKSTTSSGRRMTKHSVHGLNEASPHKESRDGHGDKKDSKHSLKGEDKSHHKHDYGRKNSTGNMKDRKKAEKIVVKVSEQVPADESTVKRGSIDKTRRLSFIVESFNKEKEEKIKEQNNLFSRFLTLNDVVLAAMDQVSETNSTISRDISTN